ncbi:unnamed protein product [Spirodela intermedia]|uniref:Cyanobacterial aminoacyl-tRNA synthetase CAAD domain-containing protein n=1 Tax=Spirodela intermedia TaxID=51605 RepID=A0A7I8IJI6_SPIIN|nr:unnamed protein product [Spirodela intermedia]CAA6658046.1 unnamed protein product [Spirodela intermedia]
MGYATAACAVSSTSTALMECRGGGSSRQQAATPHCVGLPPLSPRPQRRAARRGPAPTVSRRICLSLSLSLALLVARNVVSMATGESVATAAATTAVDAPAEGGAAPAPVTEVPEIWNKVEDKYAVSSLAVAGVVALWGTGGMISAIDRLPLVPGVLEVVGIGYTGWFAYKNLLKKPEREALIAKIKNTYNEILGSSQ